MRCTDKGTLRTYLDGELAPHEASELAHHVEGCAGCSARLTALSVDSALAQEQLARLVPRSMPDPRRAVQKVRSRSEAKHVDIPVNWRNGLMKSKTWRAVAIGAVVLALLVGTFSFGATRALARQLLSVFRVRRFAIVQIDPNQADMENLSEVLQDSLFTQEPEILVDEPQVTASSIEEARELAGFDARMPSHLPGDGPTTISVKGRSEMGFAVQPEGLALLFEMAGMDPALVPEDLGDGQIHAIIPAMVAIEHGPYTVIQVLDPVIEYPDGVDPQLFGQLGLRLLGLSPKEAQRISESIDWATTLVLPVPTDQVTVTETVIAGEEALLLGPADYSSDRMLVFQKGDVVYAVSGRTDNMRLTQIAESMF